MSEAASYDPNWWQAPKAASLERKARAKAVGSALAKLGDTFLIVTEGTVTEPVYFDLLLQDLQLSTVWIKVIPGDASHPRHVIATAAREATAQAYKARKGRLGIDEQSMFDHVWAVIDTDVAVREGIWNNVQQSATAKKVKLAHSSPCFEFWLLLHLAYTTRSDLHNGDAAKAALKKVLGRDYSTTKETAREAIGSFFSKWPTAVEHAARVRQHHHGAATPLPANPSTEMDRLVRALYESMPEHLRKLRS